MQNSDGKQKSLAKTYKSTKIIAWLLVFGGGAMVAISIGQAVIYGKVVLTSLTFGIVLMVGSLPLFVLGQLAKKKLDQLGI